MAKEKQPLSKEERRARRAARRAKQREANAGRAAKMHAARIEFEAGIRESSESSRTLETPARDDSIPAVNIGCSGWFYWRWRNGFYPQDLPTKNWFAHYAGHFQTVELNAPFYSWPTVAAVQSWARQVQDRQFIYTVKACELITHVKQFTGTKTLVRDFSFIADILGPRMGCFLFQLPPSFHYTSARLRRILSQLDPKRRNVVEFRHSSWWKKEVFAAFTDANAIFCSCSGPRLPDELVKIADEIYLRFHGTKQWYRHDYTAEELNVWTSRIAASRPKRVWAYFNNDSDCHAIKNAQELLGQLRSQGKYGDTAAIHQRSSGKS